MYQEITVLGYLGRDPEMRFTPTGTAVTSFSIAASTGFGDNKRTIWFKVSVWGNQAEPCNKYLKKGQQAVVIGELLCGEDGNPSMYDRKDGTKGASFEINARKVVFGQKDSPDAGQETEFNYF